MSSFPTCQQLAITEPIPQYWRVLMSKSSGFNLAKSIASFVRTVFDYDLFDLEITSLYGPLQKRAKLIYLDL